MELIPLSPIPNQSVAINVDGAYWQIHLFQAIDKMYADISRNGQVIISGTRCFSGIGIMPFEHMYAPRYGNFIFDAEVDWNNFSASCRLFYLNANELLEYENMSLAQFETVGY